jgi:hypothetical protein
MRNNREFVPLDKDRKMGIVLIIVLIASWTLAYNTTSGSLQTTGMIVGLVCFMWVMVLMGKSVDKHGWGDAPTDDEDPDKKDKDK